MRLQRRPLVAGSAFVVALSLTACASRQPAESGDDVPTLVAPPTSAESIRDTAAPNYRNHRSITPIETADELTESQRAIRQAQVQKYVNFYAKADRARFQRHLDRAEPYRWLVEQIFEEHGVPGDLFYLGVIESGFQNHAKSKAAAVGIWQFIPGTADRYQLDVDRYIDERRDPIRATAAAAKYLKDLHNVFHSWPLAMAAYNAGEGRVLGAIMRGKTRNFWELVDKKKLPTETAQYVPRIIAAMLISKNRERYGLRKAPDYTYPVLKLADVPSGVSLFNLARASGVPMSELKSYNPHLLRDMTPPRGARQSVWVTEDTFASVQRAALALRGSPNQFASFKPTDTDGNDVKSLPGMKKSVTRTVAAAPKREATSSTRTRRVFVKRGENLFEIAKRFGMSTAELKKLNNLKSSQVVAGQSLKVPAASFRPNRSLVNYRVRPGDNLHRIAKKFGKSVDELRSINALKRETVFAGEVLKIDTSGI